MGDTSMVNIASTITFECTGLMVPSLVLETKCDIVTECVCNLLCLCNVFFDKGA